MRCEKPDYGAISEAACGTAGGGQRQAKKAHQQFKRDPWHKSLRFKQVHPSLAIYSIRVTRGYRAVGKRDEKGMLWYWIGSHANYDKLLKQQ